MRDKKNRLKSIKKKLKKSKVTTFFSGLRQMYVTFVTFFFTAPLVLLLVLRVCILGRCKAGRGG
jgi:hypothetical protein